MEDQKKPTIPSTAEEVLAQFKKQEELVTVGKATFKIRKITGLSLGSGLSLPFFSKILAIRDLATPEERLAETNKISEDPEASKQMTNSLVLNGVLEPKFSLDGAPGTININDVDPELKDMLAIKVSEFSGFAKEAADFFRPAP